MPETISAKELAALCETDAKSMRRFIRAQAQAGDGAIVSACGQGNRYGFSPGEAQALRAAFASHASGRKAHAPERSLADLEALLSDDESAESDA